MKGTTICDWSIYQLPIGLLLIKDPQSSINTDTFSNDGYLYNSDHGPLHG